MNAKHKNASERALFLSGGRLDVLMYGHQQLEQCRQQEKEEAHKIMTRGLKSFGRITECPCGCGLQGDICEAYASEIIRKNDDVPF